MRPRLIPVLTLDRNRRLVKTVGFGVRTYIGDPFNILRLFNEKEVDEIILLDIDATIDGRAPDLGFIREVASECFIPLAYGGGLKDVATCEALGRIGVEKLVVGTCATEGDFLPRLSAHMGAQAVVGCVDYRGKGDEARSCVLSGRKMLSSTPLNRALLLQELGCGEIILQSVDDDGSRAGYDLDLIGKISAQLDVPMIALGGAGNMGHLSAALKVGASAAASGSAFSFLGRLRAVLINYPEAAQIERLGECLVKHHWRHA